MIIFRFLGMITIAAVMLVSCRTRHEVDVKPVEIKPIHITIDVNVRVEKALEDFFNEIDQADPDAVPSAQEEENPAGTP